MKPSRLCLSAALVPLLLASCQTAGHQRVDATSSRLEELRTSLEQLDGEVTATADSLASVVEKAGEDPKPAFEQYGKDVKAVERSYARARSRLSEAEKEATKLFDEWTRNASMISDPDLKALSERRRDELKEVLDEVVGAMQTAVAELESFVTTSRDLHTYLSQDLTPSGIRAIADKSRAHGKAARTISGLIEDVMDAAEEAAPRFETATPPPPPAEG
jgi:outer membrane murein-binding lipoprotein Lpp